MKNRSEFLAALAALPDPQLDHVAAVMLDVAKRLPEHAFDGVVKTLGDEKFEPIDWAPPVVLDPNLLELTGPDGEKYVVVKKSLSGVAATGETETIR